MTRAPATYHAAPEDGPIYIACGIWIGVQKEGVHHECAESKGHQTPHACGVCTYKQERGRPREG